MDERNTVNIIGAGISGLTAAITLAEAGIGCSLISSQPSERAQSVLAEGGINAALDTMGEKDSTEDHFTDTMRAGAFLASGHAVRNLTESAPDIVEKLVRLGVPFESERGRLILRNFGGQKKKRTAYAKSSTGKMIMTALIDETRKHEASGLVRRYPHHELTGLDIRDGALRGVAVRDTFTGAAMTFTGNTILCTGGLNGFFEGMTTGTTQNSGNAAALAFHAGVEFADLEFIQYHPTTVQICSKRMLISEAARGEGGRLYVLRNGTPWYFMEEKYPELGNLMPRDVISREMALLSKDPSCGEIFLDLTGISERVWKTRLSDLWEEILQYLRIDVKNTPVPVRPGIHYFMGGIRVNGRHETNIRGLFSAGEAACQYHGANRLGGNSMLGAIVGGREAARSAFASPVTERTDGCVFAPAGISSAMQREKLKEALKKGLGIVRTLPEMEEALNEVNALGSEEGVSGIDRMRARFGAAMLESAIARRESRGAHYRTDFPRTDDAFRKKTVVKYGPEGISVRFTGTDGEAF